MEIKINEKVSNLHKLKNINIKPSNKLIKCSKFTQYDLVTHNKWTVQFKYINMKILYNLVRNIFNKINERKKKEKCKFTKQAD